MQFYMELTVCRNYFLSILCWIILMPTIRLQISIYRIWEDGDSMWLDYMSLGKESSHKEVNTIIPTSTKLNKSSENAKSMGSGSCLMLIKIFSIESSVEKDFLIGQSKGPISHSLFPLKLTMTKMEILIEHNVWVLSLLFSIFQQILWDSNKISLPTRMEFLMISPKCGKEWLPMLVENQIF